MTDRVDGETVEYVSSLAQLELSEKEKDAAGMDMGRMLDYIGKLNELDTTGVQPMFHVLAMQNVFREDVVTNGDGNASALQNAPEKRDGMFAVPKSFD